MMARSSSWLVVTTLTLASALVFLSACAPSREVVCSKLVARRAPGPRTDAELREACDARLRGMSSGEYGACAQCIVDGVRPQQLAECRVLCPTMLDLIPEAPP